MALPLVEALTYDQAGIRTQIVENQTGGKDLYMEGIFIQGGVKNQNQRVYPVNEIARACSNIAEKIKKPLSKRIVFENLSNTQINVRFDGVDYEISNT